MDTLNIEVLRRKAGCVYCVVHFTPKGVSHNGVEIEAYPTEKAWVSALIDRLSELPHSNPPPVPEPVAAVVEPNPVTPPPAPAPQMEKTRITSRILTTRGR